MTSAPSWVLWAGTCDLMGDLETRIWVAAQGPYDWVSLSALDLAAEERIGRSAVEVGDRVRAAGLRSVFDPLVGWHPVLEEPVSPFAAIGFENALSGAADVGAELVSVIPQPHSALDVDGMVAAFGEVCDRIDDFGGEAQLEFMPFSSVPDLRSAWEIVRRAGRSNAGLLVDAWHFFRSEPDFELLADIDGRHVFSVQLDDGPLLPTPGTREETMDRDLPGAGEFDLYRFLRVLDSTGGLARVGGEVINPQHRALPAEEACARSQASVERVMAAAGVLEGDPTGR